MKRRSTLLLATLAGLAACSAPDPAEPAAGRSTEPVDGPVSAPGDRTQAGTGTLDDWPDRDPGLGSGYCFTLVQGLDSAQVIERLGGRELERVGWDLVVGPGDGERAGAGRFFAGVARVGDWALIVEDNGSLGVTRAVAGPLSEGRTVLAYRGNGAGRGRLMVFEDAQLVLDFDSAAPDRSGGSRPGDFVPAMRSAGLIGGPDVTDHTAPALRFLAQQTGVALTSDLVKERTYLLVTVPKP